MSVLSCRCRGSSRGVVGAEPFTGVSAAALSYASSSTGVGGSDGCIDSSAVAKVMYELARDAARAGSDPVLKAVLNADGGAVAEVGVAADALAGVVGESGCAGSDDDGEDGEGVDSAPSPETDDDWG